MNFWLRLKWRIKAGKGGYKPPLFRPLKPSDYHAIQGIITYEQMKLWLEKNREFIELIADMEVRNEDR